MIKRFLKVAVLLALVLALVTGSAAFAQDITYDSQKLDTNYALALAYIGKEDYDKAMEYLDACLKYALTDELYVGERYNDANVWYYPWSPNASGAGRIAMMLLER